MKMTITFAPMMGRYSYDEVVLVKIIEKHTGMKIAEMSISRDEY